MIHALFDEPCRRKTRSKERPSRSPLSAPLELDEDRQKGNNRHIHRARDCSTTERSRRDRDEKAGAWGKQQDRPGGRGGQHRDRQLRTDLRREGVFILIVGKREGRRLVVVRPPIGIRSAQFCAVKRRTAPHAPTMEPRPGDETSRSRPPGAAKPQINKTIVRVIVIRIQKRAASVTCMRQLPTIDRRSN